MKLNQCQSCGQQLFFENTSCVSCGHRLGFVPNAALSALEPACDGSWTALLDGKAYKFCRNAADDVCNWLEPADSPEAFCDACRHNMTVPDLSQPENQVAWRKLESAKHRLFYALDRLGLPHPSRIDDPKEGLGFEFMEDPADPNAPKVLTGHAQGIITINVAEADDAEREKRRAAMREPYRTLLGHFRHEVGHWYWDLLIRDDPAMLARVRAAFGDDREDYAAALQRHYDQGSPAGWQNSFVSEYATTHAWEDWAETFAHYLHIVDALDTAGAYGMRLRPQLPQETGDVAAVTFDPYDIENVGPLMEAWVPFSMALNSINRSMGLPDLYPFVLSKPAMDKLGVVHDVLRQARGTGQGTGDSPKTRSVVQQAQAA